jgi:2-C-methyl-D-erythritol 4-phosphate cytidylyltransferase
MYRGLKVTALVVAAGKGTRMNTNVKKQYMLLGGKPVLARTLQAMQDCDVVDDVLVVTARGEIDYCWQNIVQAFSLSKVAKIVEGGDTRQQSVARGLEVLNCDIVIIHDGARPFVTCEIIEQGVRLLDQKGCDGAVCAVPLKDTVKLADINGVVERTLDRNRLMAAQTPQCFFLSTVKEAYKRAQAEAFEATDDSMLLERYGYTVQLYQGDYKNIKITTQEDIYIAQAMSEGGKI